GAIRVEGRPVMGPGPDRGIVFQHFGLYPRKAVIFVTHDVHEAVFLAERIAVMSSRPGHIKEIVETRFDKDDPGLARSPAFVVVDHVWNLVRGEAILVEREAVA